MKEKPKIEAEDQSGSAESSNLLSETCFHLQSQSVLENGSAQLHGAGQLVIPEDNTDEVSEIKNFQ